MREIYGYKYDEYVLLRKNIQLQRCPINEYIYISKFDSLIIISKRDISLLEIEQYSYVGRILGLELYVEKLEGGKQ